MIDENVDMSVYDNIGLAGEKNEVNNRNLTILATLRDRLLQTKRRDIDIENLIEKLPS